MADPARQDGSRATERPDLASVPREALVARVDELEALCTDILAAGIDIPAPLLNRLRDVVGHPRGAHELDVSAGPPAPEMQPITSTRTVLVVEDDPLMLHVLGRILARENFQLILASSGSEALQALDAATRPVDLLITDLTLPGLNGREVAARARARAPNLRVIYQAAAGDLAAMGGSPGALGDGEAVLAKPFTTRTLREAARLALYGALNPST